MNCEEVKISLHDFVDELLDENRKKEVESHIRSCNSCFAKYKRIRKFYDKLKNLPYTIDPPEDIINQLSEELLKKAVADSRAEQDRPKVNVKKIKREQLKQEKILKQSRGVVRKSKVTRSIFATRLAVPAVSRFSLDLKKTLLTLLPLVLIAVGYFIYDFMLINSPWKVRTVSGNVLINGQVSMSDRWEEGESLVTDQNAKAVINVPNTGRIEVSENSLLVLKKAKDGSNKIKLVNGNIRIINSNPMPSLTIELNNADIIDRGGTFELSVDEQLIASVQVEFGFIEIEQKGRVYLVDEGYICEMHPNKHPGTPYRFDASDLLKSEVAKFDYQNGGDQSVETIIGSAGERDMLTLLALITRTSEPYRLLLFNKIASYYPPPPDVTKEGIGKLDNNMLESWWFEIEWQI
ncbi:MAG TPA: FecR domain-containing protein [Melioribacteraceae bacterium]|nr:FecR domain-containing protein [Melioribacteraceae bacterium]